MTSVEDDSSSLLVCNARRFSGRCCSVSYFHLVVLVLRTSVVRICQRTTSSHSSDAGQIIKSIKYSSDQLTTIPYSANDPQEIIIYNRDKL